MSVAGAKRASINIFLLVRGVMGVTGLSLMGLPCGTGSCEKRERERESDGGGWVGERSMCVCVEGVIEEGLWGRAVWSGVYMGGDGYGKKGKR